MNKYLAGDEIPLVDLKKVLREAVINNKIIPVLCGTALKNKGVQFLLDAVVEYLPSPLDVPPVEGFHPKDEDTKIEIKASDDEPFSALAFKIATDLYVGKLFFFSCLFWDIKIRFLCFKYSYRGERTCWQNFAYACQFS